MFVGDWVRVALKVLVAAYVIVDVNDMVGVKVSVDMDVGIMMGAALVLEANQRGSRAPTDETSWATINMTAMSVAALLREARDPLA